MFIVLGPFTEKIKTPEPTTKPQTSCCSLVVLCLIGISTQQHSRNIFGVYGFVSFAVRTWMFSNLCKKLWISQKFDGRSLF